jgi:hypothetical protein
MFFFLWFPEFLQDDLSQDGEPLGAHCHEGDTLQLLLCLPRNSAAEDIAVEPLGAEFA